MGTANWVRELGNYSEHCHAPQHCLTLSCISGFVLNPQIWSQFRLRSTVTMGMHTSPSLASLPSCFLKQKSFSLNSFNDFFEVMGLNKRIKVKFFFSMILFYKACAVYFLDPESAFLIQRGFGLGFFFFWFLVHVSYKNPNVVFQEGCILLCSIFDICREVRTGICRWHLQKNLTKNISPERKHSFSWILIRIPTYSSIFRPWFEDEVKLKPQELVSCISWCAAVGYMKKRHQWGEAGQVAIVLHT